MIEQHSPLDQLEVLRVAAESERQFIAALVANIATDRP
jgi:hypothetical protein